MTNLMGFVILVIAAIVFWLIARYFYRKLDSSGNNQAQAITSKLDTIKSILNELRIEPAQDSSINEDQAMDKKIDQEFDIEDKSLQERDQEHHPAVLIETAKQVETEEFDIAIAAIEGISLHDKLTLPTFDS